MTRAALLSDHKIKSIESLYGFRGFPMTEAALDEDTRDSTVTSQVVNERAQVREAQLLIGQGPRPSNLRRAWIGFGRIAVPVVC